ncbi:MAG: biotin carboxylase N-terminal domain-containing protein, partial [Georgfuchsia sp.]
LLQHKVLIANRGEIACRVIRAAKSLGLVTVAVYSDVDADAPHVRAADEAYLLGPARPAESYLNQEKVIAVAKESGATLVHPGYGFLAENPGFAEHCTGNGLIFVGPKPDVIRTMGNKERAREIALAAGVPVVPGAEDIPSDATELAATAARVGYPLLVKAAAGGGGIGMRRVDAPADLATALVATRTMAERAFGNGTVYFERYIRRARHIEIQVFGFGDGRAVHLFERDCSTQRRHQKIIEEAVAPNLPEETRAAICAVAVKLACACRYDGAGTIEFLVDADSGEFFFLEMNTRIQVEHPVTEMVAGVDLVAAQLRYAMGEDVSAYLSQERIQATGHAIEARVYAERPAKNFIPSPGLIEELVLPQGEGIRVDTGYRAGMKVTPYYDPMIMKLIAHGATRSEAIARLDAALAALVIKGIETNTSFVRRVLAHPAFVTARVHTMFVTDSLQELIS